MCLFSLQNQGVGGVRLDLFAADVRRSLGKASGLMDCAPVTWMIHIVRGSGVNEVSIHWI